MSELEDKAALAGREITMGGIVTSVRRGVSKNGNPYALPRLRTIPALPKSRFGEMTG